MMKKYYYSLLCLLLISCVDHYSKEDGGSSNKITNSLYYEVFQTSKGGVFASDTYSTYLTDSIKFRKLVGVEHDDEQILLSMLSDNLILVYKTDFHTADTLEMNMYSISQLKKEGKWE